MNVTGTPPARARSALWLARIEAGRLLRHPAFLLGLLACLPVVLRRPPGGDEWVLPMVGWGFGWMGLMTAAALVAGRERFLADPDLFPATVAGPRERALATLLGVAAASLVAGAVVAAVAVRHTADGAFPVGTEPFAATLEPDPAHWAQPVLMFALAGTIGVAVAQLRRARLAVLIGLLVFVSVGGAGIWVSQAHPLRVLHPFLYPAYERELPASFVPSSWQPGGAALVAPEEEDDRWREVRFDTTALRWHLLYLGGLILVLAWWAARAAGPGGEARPPAWLLAAGLPLVTVGGAAQLLTAGVNA